jgi:hypothetical protein
MPERCRNLIAVSEGNWGNEKEQAKYFINPGATVMITIFCDF